MKKLKSVFIFIIIILLPACSSNNPVSKQTANNIAASKSGVVQTPAPSTLQSTAATIEEPKFSRDTYPRVDGSTATIPLSEAVASNLLGMTKDDANKFIKHNTTHNAYINLIEGKADIIFVTEPSEQELAVAKNANIELDVVPVVKEGFVFLVNVRNPVNSLTTKQIQDIYQGKIHNWKEVGGNDKEITPYQRESNSGSQTLMEQTVMKGLKIMDSPKNVVMGMEGLIENIAKYDNSEKALGYSVYYYAKTMYNKDTIKFIAVDGVMPDNTTISSGKYPFTSSYYAVLKKSDTADSASRKLLNWILGDEGQKIAEEAGYVPMEKR